MKRSLVFSGIIVVGLLLLLSCTTGKKFNYQTAYKFKYIQHQEEDESLPHILSQARTLIPEGHPENPPALKELHDPDLTASITPGINSTLNYKPELNRVLETESRERATDVQKADKKEVPGKIKDIKRKNKKIRKRRKPSMYEDTHPALKGFIWVAFGLGVILAAVILVPAEVISLILVIIGFGLVAFGFIKILSVLI